MAVSLKDISKVTNVSTCAISQVLNNHPKAMAMRPETREKIFSAARKLGYCKNELAASMSLKNSRVLAFVTCPMGGIEYTGIIQNGILNTVAARGYTIVVYRLETMSAEEIINKIIGWRVAGVVFHVADKSEVSKITEALEKNHIFYGYVNLSNSNGIGVTSDDRNGIENAVKYLVDKGHKKIAIARISDKCDLEYDMRRMQGYHDGLAKYNPEQSAEIINMCNDSSVYELIENIIERKIDGIVCISDFIASRLCNAALEMGYRVPEIFSVIGFGNSVIAESVFPPLTTISQDFELMGECAVNFIIDMIEKKNVTAEYNIMQPTFILERKSVKTVNINEER